MRQLGFRKMLVSGLAFWQATLVLAGWLPKVTFDHTNGVYRCGEVARMSVRLRPRAEANGKLPTTGKVKAVLSNFGSEELLTREFSLAGETEFELRGTLQQPGCLLLTLTGEGLLGNWGGGSFVTSVVYEPEALLPGGERPVDFDAFWDSAIQHLEEAVPCEVKMELVPDEALERQWGKAKKPSPRRLYRVSFATTEGRRVYGFLSIPTDCSRGPFPTRVTVPGAGAGLPAQGVPGGADEVVLCMNVHYFEPTLTWKGLGARLEEEAQDRAARLGGPANAYPLTGCFASRENHFYYGAILGIRRAALWLLTRPEVDRSRFTYEGTSQGGGFGLYLAGLGVPFTRVTVAVPALADQLGYLAKRRAGWPRFNELKLSSEEFARAEEIAPYFDSVNFASRVTCPIRFAVGLSDCVCPPSSGICAYNACASKDKQILIVPGMTHGVTREVRHQLQAWRCGRELAK